MNASLKKSTPFNAKKKVVAPGYYFRKENTVTWFQQSLFLYPLSQM